MNIDEPAFFPTHSSTGAIGAVRSARPLLLVTPSRHIVGGIERVTDAVIESWDGPVTRLDLLDGRRQRWRHPTPLQKVSLALRTLGAAAFNPPAHILSMHMGLLPVTVPLARTFGVPSSLFVYGEEIFGRLSSLDATLVRQSGECFAISSFTRDVLIRRSRVPPERVRLVRLPVATSLLESLVAIPQTPGDCHGTRLLSVGRITRQHRYKGYDSVAHALPLVAKTVPTAEWHVVGDGDYLPDLKRLCAALGITQRVTFYGEVPDAELRSIYAMADIFVLPSVADVDRRPPIGEGFGLVFAEAAAAALPLVGSASGGGALDIVVNGKTGLTADGTPESLATVLTTLLEDPALRQRLGANARTFVETNHTMNAFKATLRGALTCA